MKTGKIITLGLFTLCTIGLTNNIFAGNKPEDPAELKLVGNVQNHPVFKLNLNNKQTNEYIINIKDENSNVLYSEKIKGANISRTYQLAVDEADLNAPGFGIKFEVTPAASHKTQVYKISTQTKVTENILVTQL